MTTWRIGCSGFHYKHWKEIFYPQDLPQTKWFDYYCRHFDTLELNVTFYNFPKLPSLQSWYEKSPDNFIFSVKAPRAITHFKKFKGTEEMMKDFYGTTRKGLKKKLGPVLFQMPPAYKYNEERLDTIIAQLDTGFTNVMEFRHPSWWVSDVYKKLAKKKISFCGMSHPELPSDIIQNTKKLYYRFHGVPNLYSSKYDTALLKKFYDEVANEGKTKQAFIYFNNDIGGSAVSNALTMKEFG